MSEQGLKTPAVLSEQSSQQPLQSVQPSPQNPENLLFQVQQQSQSGRDQMLNATSSYNECDQDIQQYIGQNARQQNNPPRS